MAVVAAAGIVGLSATGGAVAAGQIGSAGIADDSVRSVDLKDGRGVGVPDLRNDLKTYIDSKEGSDGTDGTDGSDGSDGLAGAVYRTLTYTNGGTGSATVACADTTEESMKYTAISGGVQGSTDSTQSPDAFAVTSSFPGRMNWDTGTPREGRLDGWIVLGNGQYTETLTVWALCVPNTSIPVDAGSYNN